ncbi:hypothetical protein [Rosenbergiella australiborealis]|uniref:hypothetical protein n=1 Tax=Rosenbergiella australiborealis TaxID=1544696 RepID=UPI001F4DF684|nr:hypothetical protein [Rosenbergiella australiborealis]
MKFQPRYKTLSVVLPLLLLASCLSPPQKLQQREAAVPTPCVSVTRNVQTVAPDEYVRMPEVVRYDRYLLVSTDPMAAQRDPLSQIIDIRIPSSLHPTVADALRTALQVMAGPAWQLEVDDIQRLFLERDAKIHPATAGYVVDHKIRTP